MTKTINVEQQTYKNVLNTLANSASENMDWNNVLKVSEDLSLANTIGGNDVDASHNFKKRYNKIVSQAVVTINLATNNDKNIKLSSHIKHDIHNAIKMVHTLADND